MSGIQPRGRRGFTIVPNWWWEQDHLDTYELAIAGWLASHAGQYLHDHVTRNIIAKRTHISAGKVSQVIRRLEQIGLITVDTIPGYTIPRWVITFDFDVWEASEVGHHMTKGWSPHDQGAVSHLPIEEEQQENITTLVPLADDFDSFWGSYPRKVKKPAARKAWAAAVKRESVETILIGASRVITLWQKYGYEQRFIPYASSWLNNDGWDDEVAPQATTKTAPGMGALRRILAEEQQ